ncbi:YopX family protein [Priestia megaterium]|uniref:YopX family protein n=1 Tax=Priestia megaterium TaxID=1404 RepID=UPI000CA17225|nr:YopX family protein [Priestia megaterium]AUO14752.1 hypothetical protein C0569_26045 [Priestia megaterium]
MREIKFRLFSKTKNKMLGWEDLKRKKNVSLRVLEDNDDNERFSFWMQYTGLTDKNDKEIYEGDIIKGCGWDNEEQIFYVKFGNGEYFLEAPESADYEYYNGDYPHGDRVDNWCEGEVIGNIYENPELIK